MDSRLTEKIPTETLTMTYSGSKLVYSNTPEGIGSTDITKNGVRNAGKYTIEVTVKKMKS